MHFEGYLQLSHKIKKLKEGFVCFKYFTDPKKQMKDCTNTKYLDLNSNTHRGKHHVFRPEDLPSYFSFSPLPFTALDTLDKRLEKKVWQAQCFSVPFAVPNRIRIDGCMNRL